eukprot:6335340-Lingulodinium_polyedra.AAC.1
MSGRNSRCAFAALRRLCVPAHSCFSGVAQHGARSQFCGRRGSCMSVVILWSKAPCARRWPPPTKTIQSHRSRSAVGQVGRPPVSSPATRNGELFWL